MTPSEAAAYVGHEVVVVVCGDTSPDYVLCGRVRAATATGILLYFPAEPLVDRSERFVPYADIASICLTIPPNDKEQPND